MNLLILFCFLEVVAGKTYIVRMDNLMKPLVFPSFEQWYRSSVLAVKKPSEEEENNDKRVHFPQNDVLVHVYRTVFHGFSVKLTELEAEELAKASGVLGIFPDGVRQLHTTRSQQFLGLKPDIGLWPKSEYGSDIVVGILDSGIWPERRSFHDHGMGPVPEHWKGECEEGVGFSRDMCNRKLVGARYFAKGYESNAEFSMNSSVEFRSARDSDGHGTHTASIAVGRHVYRAGMLGFAEGIAKGAAPEARLAVYKVCWASGCADSDILAAFDRAVEDGVDIISLSVGGGVVPYFEDAIAIGAFGAVAEGVFVATSAGNGGPWDLSVTNVSPWVTTVGAGTLDRDFPAEIRLGNGFTVQGLSLYSGNGKDYMSSQLNPLVFAGDLFVGNSKDAYLASHCTEGSLEPKFVKDKIVACYRGNNSRVAKGAEVKRAGGVGMILLNRDFDGAVPVAEAHVLPTVAVGAKPGEIIRDYISTAKSATAMFVFMGTVVGISPAPNVAAFSARGPNPLNPEIVKPDLIAPGVGILGAWTRAKGPSGFIDDTRRTEFSIQSGTSMSCPHVSGVAALLKHAYPRWSPAALRSALMTTAYTRNDLRQHMLDQFTGNASTPFDYGAGHIHPERAMDPGLIYDLTTKHYIQFLCSLRYTRKSIRMITHKPARCPHPGKSTEINKFNYPSFSAVFDVSQTGTKVSQSTVFKRVVTNVGSALSVYDVQVVAPREKFSLIVRPKKLVFTSKGQKLKYNVTLIAKPLDLKPGEYDRSYGFLVWTDGMHFVHSPVVVIMQNP